MSSIRVPLSVFDNIMPRIYAYTIYCLPMKPEEEPRNVHGYLEEALSKTVEQMPLLGGTLVFHHSSLRDTRKGSLEIVIPQRADERIVPLLFQDLRAALDYDDLMADGLPDGSLDAKLLLPTGLIADLQTGAAVLVAQANFLEGGCFLSVGLHHSVADGGAAVYMMQIWAHHCRQLQNPEISMSLPAISQEGLDRNILKTLWIAGGNKHDDNAYRNASDKLWRFLGVNPVTNGPESQNGIAAPAITPNTETSIFYVSERSLAKLRDAGTNSDLSGVTANDALMALLWRSIAKARFPAEDPIYASNETAILDTTVDGRAQFSPDCPQDYFGNLVLMNTTYMSLASLTSFSTSLSSIAAEIRKTLVTVSAAQEHAAMTLAASIPDYSHLTFPFATFEGTELCVTSTLNMPLFHLDFGRLFGNDGKPESIRSPKSEFASICRRCVVLPRRTNGGFEILISLVEGEMGRLMADEEFAQYAKFCCH